MAMHNLAINPDEKGPVNRHRAASVGTQETFVNKPPGLKCRSPSPLSSSVEHGSDDVANFEPCLALAGLKDRRWVDIEVLSPKP